MLAKVITLTHSIRGKGFGSVLRYILHGDAMVAVQDQKPESGHINLEDEPLWSAAENPAAYAEDLAAIFDADVRQCRRRGRFHGNPVYHVAINWKAGEDPTAVHAEHASRHMMKALGFEKCQAVWAIHRDTDNDHVHLVINRVHPAKHTAMTVPRRDYLILDRCMRELELELGFARAEGPYITLDTAEGPKILRMSRAERAARGLLQDPRGSRLSVRAQRAEHNLGTESFQRWINGAPGAAVRQALGNPDVTWKDVHRVLAEYACAIGPKGSGLVVTTTLASGRVLAAKASSLGRWAGKASLEAILAPYVVSTQHPGKRHGPLRETYEQSITRGRLEETRVRPVSEDPARLARRAERVEARQELAERFTRDELQSRTERSRRRAELRRRHEAERLALRAAHREQRRRVRAAAPVQRRDGGMAFSLWAFKAAKEREGVQRCQAAERRALSAHLPRGEVWRVWLERQAGSGDAAARSALRGIRYRERRRHREDAIEGKESAPQWPLTVGALRADADAARSVIIYRRADGVEVFRDTGPRFVVRDKRDESLEAALRVAAQKYGGRVRITGSNTFRGRAARMATRLGVIVENPDLQSIVQEARRQMPERSPEPQTLVPSRPTHHRPRSRSRGLER